MNNVATYDFRIASGSLNVSIRKKRPFPFNFLPRKFYYFSIQLQIVTASGVQFDYEPFKLFLTKQQAKETLTMFKNICQHNNTATQYVEHQNINIRQLVYVKQSDFRDTPIRMVVESDVNAKGSKMVKTTSPPNKMNYAPDFVKAQAFSESS